MTRDTEQMYCVIRLTSAAALTVLLSTGTFAETPAVPGPATASSETVVAKVPLDYATLTHTISIEMLRAGSHDPSGTNDYFFTVTLYGVLNTSEQRNLDFAASKKVVVERGNFGDTHIDSLDVWKPDAKLKNYKEFKIEGNAIRELAANAMTEFKVQESDIAVMVEIAMFEKNKRFIFLGDDTPIAKTSYHPIPATKFDLPLRTNQTLTITDDKGTYVKFLIKYEAAKI